MRFYWANRAFRNYMGAIYRLFHRQVEYIGRDKIPTDGKGLIVVCNHQNAINGPFILETFFNKRQLYIFAMGKALSIPVLGKFIKWLGVLPAYRMRTDGAESLSKNAASFQAAGDLYLQGETLAIYPESTNQICRWLGEFSYGYLRMAFSIAERTDFQEDIRILPMAEHFSHYHHMQSRALVQVGEIVSLKPFYEEYKTKPRTTWRKVNAIIYEQVHNMMLDVRDLDNYEAIDCILSRERRKNRPLSVSLAEEKKLFAKIESLTLEESSKIFADSLALNDFFKQNGLRDWLFDHKINLAKIILGWAAMLLTLPLFIFSLIPNIIVFLAPEPLVKKINKIGPKYELFASGIRYAVSGLITIPLVWTIAFIVDCCSLGWLFALIHLILEPLCLLFIWYYIVAFLKMRGMTRFFMLSGTEKLNHFRQIRENILRHLAK